MGMFWGKIKEISRIVREVDPGDILVPPGRIRSVDRESLRTLAESVAENGIIEPLILRRNDRGQYELVAGERRLRAAEMAGLATVPCVSIDAGEVDAAVIAIIENLHREDLNMFEEAQAILSLITLSGMTQEQCARRLSVSQSYIANKIRLLRLTDDERRAILEGGLSERHARALLRFPDPDERGGILRVFLERGMNVSQAEEYAESMLCAASRQEEIRSKPDKSEQKWKLIVRDIRLFYNSIDHAVDVIQRSGIPVTSSRQETPEGVEIRILLPKAQKGA